MIGKKKYKHKSGPPPQSIKAFANRCRQNARYFAALAGKSRR